MSEVNSEFLEEFVLDMQALQVDEVPGGLPMASAFTCCCPSYQSIHTCRCGGASNFLENPLVENESGQIDFDLIVF